MTTTEMLLTPTTAPSYPLIDLAWGEDLLAGIPREVVERIGSADVDTAGGCG